MKSALKKIANHFQEEFGVPATVAQVIEGKPTLLVQPEFPEDNIDAESVIRWDRFGSAFNFGYRPNSRTGVMSGWTNIGGYYQGVNLERPYLMNFGQEEITENWSCDIQDVSGVSASKSKLREFANLDDMVETNSRDMITPVTEGKMRKNLQHDEIRILRDNSCDYFVQYQWDGRFFLKNSGGSHHFAAARYIAARLDHEVPLTGRLFKRSLNPLSVASLRREFDIYVISDNATAYMAFHDAMHRFLATYFWMPLPHGFCDQARALLLPKDNRRSLKVSKLMRSAGAFDLGAHLRELVSRQR